jgi:hypothetical protein
MFDATALVAQLDLLDAPREQAVARAPDVVAVSAVLKGGAAVTAAFAVVCIVGSHASGTVLLHPLLAWVLALMSSGFYLMGRVKN